jgi:sugar phosphate isomerase/epimerase
VELAPTKRWDDPTQAPSKEVQEYKKFWESYGLEVVAFQSMLFNRPDLKIFANKKDRQQALEYLQAFISLAGDMGVKRMVFGSPKNRQKGDLDSVAALAIAKEFFTKLGDAAQENDVCFCIEPNPVDYECDFITTASEGLALVKAISNPGFGLHLDTAGMTLAKDNLKAAITEAGDALKHFHISAPFLGQVEDQAGVHHAEAAAALKSIDYQGFVSIEMRPGEAGDNRDRIEKAVTFAQQTYV